VISLVLDQSRCGPEIYSGQIDEPFPGRNTDAPVASGGEVKINLCTFIVLLGQLQFKERKNTFTKSTGVSSRKTLVGFFHSNTASPGEAMVTKQAKLLS